MSDTRTEQRKEFEQWYATNAFDYVSNPIGSRECGLQWAAWRAAQLAASPAIKESLTNAATIKESLQVHPAQAQRIDDLEAANAGLLMANRDCIDHYTQLKADYDAAQLAAPVAPEGWRLVPREATDEMMQAAWDMSNALHGTPEADDPLPRHIYRAMIDAAPQGEGK